MSGSPTSRTVERLRSAGWLTAIVEKRNAFVAHSGARTCSACGKASDGGILQDLFGFIDILGVREGEGFLGVQATSTSNVVSRVMKVADSDLLMPRLRTWLAAGGKFEVWGWALRGAAGARKLYALDRRVFYSRSDGTVGVLRGDDAVARGLAAVIDRPRAVLTRPRRTAQLALPEPATLAGDAIFAEPEDLQRAGIPVRPIVRQRVIG